MPTPTNESLYLATHIVASYSVKRLTFRLRIINQNISQTRGNFITYLQTHSGTQRVTSSRHAQYRYPHSTTRLIHGSRCPQSARG